MLPDVLTCKKLRNSKGQFFVDLIYLFIYFLCVFGSGQEDVQ